MPKQYHLIEGEGITPESANMSLSQRRSNLVKLLSQAEVEERLEVVKVEAKAVFTLKKGRTRKGSITHFEVEGDSLEEVGYIARHTAKLERYISRYYLTEKVNLTEGQKEIVKRGKNKNYS